MRAVVADTAPLNYLVLIAAVEILPRLYESVLIPQAVRNERLTQKPRSKFATGSRSRIPG